jgi:hypothetical protein
MNLNEIFMQMGFPKKYRVVLDGNGDYRVQYHIVTNAMVGPPEWHFKLEKYASYEDAERSIGECSIQKVVKEF